MEITFVGIYAETSPACVSIIGSSVKDPPPFSFYFNDSGKSFISLATLLSFTTFADLSRSLE